VRRTDLWRARCEPKLRLNRITIISTASIPGILKECGWRHRGCARGIEHARQADLTPISQRSRAARRERSHDLGLIERFRVPAHRALHRYMDGGTQPLELQLVVASAAVRGSPSACLSR